MIRLATRLTAGSGRDAMVRLLLTGVGLALAVTMLLFAAVAFPALHAHDVRRAWIETSEDNVQPAQDESATDPLLWRLVEVRFDGQDVVRVDLAPEGADAPVPPGLTELPGPGEIAVSPALRDLLATTDPTLLAERFDGQVSAVVGRQALASPDDLVAFVGHNPAELRDQPGVLSVLSIESAASSHELTRIMRVVLVVGGVGLLAPVVVFVATATRLAAARRDRRLAAIRLVGATQRQIGVVAAVEAAIAAVGGTAAGFAVFFAVRPWLARIPFDGATFYPSDLRLSWTWAVLVAIAVPTLAVVAAIGSLRRLRVSPLGVVRNDSPRRATPRPLLLVGLGLTALVAAQTTMRSGSDIAVAAAVGAAFVLMILGIVLSGPWFTSLVGRVLARFGRSAPSLLAARRLQDNPAAGFRAISGLILAVFLGTVFSAFASSILAQQDVDSGGLRSDVVTATTPPVLATEPAAVEQVGPVEAQPKLAQWPVVAPDQARLLVEDLEAVPGVDHVLTGHPLPDEPQVLSALAESEEGLHPFNFLAGCDDAESLGLEHCDGTVVLVLRGDHELASTGVTVTDLVPVDELADLPVMAVAAVTDGSTQSIEAARTQMERHLPGAAAMTQADIDAESMNEVRTTQRVSNIALAVTLIIAGCSLAVAIAGAIVERRQPFALLRLAGTRLSDLRRIVLTEAAAPLLMVAAASAGLGMAVTALTLALDSNSPAIALPGLSYWLALVGGIVVALLVVLATTPLLSHLTSPDTTRFE